MLIKTDFYGLLSRVQKKRARRKDAKKKETLASILSFRAERGAVEESPSSAPPAWSDTGGL